MPRDYRPRELALKNRARRDNALARRDLREPSAARQAATSPTSFAVKAVDPDVRRMIDEALARRVK
jgi:hypothetical protein